MSARELFVWYRCPAAQAEAVEAAARRLLRKVAHEFGLNGRLLLRKEADCTWMEHYAGIPAAVTLPAVLACMQAAWSPALPARHAEPFAERHGEADPP